MFYIWLLIAAAVMCLMVERAVYENFAPLDFTGGTAKDIALRAGPVIYSNLFVNKPSVRSPPSIYLRTPQGRVDAARAQLLPFMKPNHVTL